MTRLHSPTLLILVAIGAFLVPQPTANASLSWSSPVAVVQSGPFLSSVPSALQAANGTVWLAWVTNFYRGDSNFDIAYRTGILGTSGVTWSPMLRFSNTGFNSHPSLVQLQNGTILLLYGYRAGPNTQIYYARYNNSAWSNPTQIVSSPLNDTIPSAAVGRDGTLWLVWTRVNVTCTSCTQTQQLYYKTMKNGVWSQEVRLTSDSNLNYGSSVTVGKDGVVRVVWSKGAAGQDIFQLYYKTYSGTMWSSESQIVTSGFADEYPSMMQDRNGTLWLFWRRVVVVSALVSYSVLFSKYSYDIGQTWTSERQMTNTSTNVDSTLPSVIQSTNDQKIWVFYATNPTATFEVWALTTVTPVAPVCDVGLVSIKPVYSPSNYFQYAGGHRGLNQSPLLTLNVTLANPGDAAEIVSVSLTMTNTTSYSYNIVKSGYVPNGGYSNLLMNWNTTIAKPARYSASAQISIVTPSCTMTLGNQPDSRLYAKNLVRLYYQGDIDQDGDVSILDASIFFAGYNTQTGQPRYNVLADITGDGTIDIIDVSIMLKNYNLLS